MSAVEPPVVSVAELPVVSVVELLVVSVVELLVVSVVELFVVNIPMYTNSEINKILKWNIVLADRNPVGVKFR